MDKFMVELIVAIREIKEILRLHTEEIEILKESFHSGKKEALDERLVKLALEGSKNLYVQTMENRVEKKLSELENAVREISNKVGKPGDMEREEAEEHLSRLRKALAE